MVSVVRVRLRSDEHQRVLLESRQRDKPGVMTRVIERLLEQRDELLAHRRVAEQLDTGGLKLVQALRPAPRRRPDVIESPVRAWKRIGGRAGGLRAAGERSTDEVRLAQGGAALDCDARLA